MIMVMVKTYAAACGNNPTCRFAKGNVAACGSMRRLQVHGQVCLDRFVWFMLCVVLERSRGRPSWHHETPTKHREYSEQERACVVPPIHCFQPVPSGLDWGAGWAKKSSLTCSKYRALTGLRL